MKRSFVGVLACMTVVGLSLTAGAQAEAPVQPDYRVVTGSSGDLVSDDAFDLQSAVSGSSLTYKRQGSLGGINLGWDTKHGDYQRSVPRTTGLFGAASRSGRWACPWPCAPSCRGAPLPSRRGRRRPTWRLALRRPSGRTSP